MDIKIWKLEFACKSKYIVMGVGFGVLLVTNSGIIGNIPQSSLNWSVLGVGRVRGFPRNLVCVMLGC